jgi:long-chain fatty acid transport protein
MRIARLATLVFTLLAIIPLGLHASGFENTGLGTTARGMGGAFRAVANDWTAAYYNPAGYAYIVDNQLGGALALFNLRNEITPDYAAVDDFGNEYGWGIVNGQTVYNYHRVLNNPSAGFIVRLPVWGETVFGLSAYQPFDQNITWRLYALDGSLLTAYNPDAVNNRLVPSTHYQNDLDVVAFQLTAGHEFIENQLALGVGLQLLRGDLHFRDLNFRDNPREGTVADRPRDRIPEFTDNSGMGWGFGLRAGLLYKLNDQLDIGVTGYLPFDITIDGNTDFTFVMPYIEPLQRGDIAADSPDTLFANGQIARFQSDFKAKLRLPASFGGGIAFRPTEKLLVALDAEYTLWSHYDGLAFDYSSFLGVSSIETEWFTQNLTSPVEWKDAGKVALGLSYDIADQLTLLAGGSADQSPSRDSREITPQFMDLGTKYGFDIGGILHINQWYLGFATSYYDYPDLNVQGLTDPNGDNVFDNFPGEYKAQTYETVLSVGYRF